MKEFVTIAGDEYTHENVIEKSRFIASAIRADTAEQAMEFVEQKRKSYYDATHNCYAYIRFFSSLFVVAGKEERAAFSSADISES